MTRFRFSAPLAAALLAWLFAASALATPVQAPAVPPAPAPGPAALAPVAPTPAAAPSKPKAPALPIEMKAVLKADAVYPGDPIPLVITFRSEAPFTADTLGTLDLGELELKDRDVQHLEEGGAHIVRHTLRLIGFKPGRFDVPPIRFALKQNGKEEERASDPVRVTVKSLLEEEARKLAEQAARDQQQGQAPKPQQGATLVDPRLQTPPPTLGAPTQPGAPAQPGTPTPQAAPQGQQVKLAPRDIKDPVPLVRQDYTPAYIAGAVAALALLALGIWLWRRHLRRKVRRTEEEAPPVDTRPPHVIALAELAALEAEGLIAKREFKRFHERLSLILREYLGRRYDNAEARTLTTPEMLEWMRRLYIRELSERALDEVLGSCDLVLFAKDEPHDADCFTRLEQVRLIVTRTTPTEAPHELR